MKGIKISKVTSIQVGGGPIVNTLEEACQKYVKPNELMRAKIQFIIKDKRGKTRSITIRDDDTFGTVAYGDFDGLIDFLDYAKIVEGKVVGE